MNGKDLLRSKAFWGIVVMLLSGVLRQSGITVDGVDMDGLTSDLAMIGGAALAIMGRVKAARPIASVGGIPLGKGG